MLLGEVLDVGVRLIEDHFLLIHQLLLLLLLDPRLRLPLHHTLLDVLTRHVEHALDVDKQELLEVLEDAFVDLALNGVHLVLGRTNELLRAGKHASELLDTLEVLVVAQEVLSKLLHLNAACQRLEAQLSILCHVGRELTLHVVSARCRLILYGLGVLLRVLELLSELQVVVLQVISRSLIIRQARRKRNDALLLLALNLGPGPGAVVASVTAALVYILLGRLD